MEQGAHTDRSEFNSYC